MRAADFHPTSSTDVRPACSEDRWQAIALAYRQLASGQRLLLEERADAGEILVDSALRRLATLGIEKVFVQDPGACGPSLDHGEPVFAAEHLAAMAEATEALPDGALKQRRRETLALLRALSALVARGDELVLGMLGVLRNEDP